MEIFSYKALEWFYLNSLHFVKREHISLKFEKFCSFPVNNLKSREKFSGLRLTIDYKKDYEVMKIFFENLYFEKILFSFKEVKKFFKEFPEIFNLNSHISPDAGVLKILQNALKIWNGNRNCLKTLKN